MAVLDSIQEVWDQCLTYLQGVDLRDRRVQVALVATGLTAFYIVRQMTKKRYHLPPGPRAWPIAGNMLSLIGSTKTMYEICVDLAEKYGDVFTLYLGPMPTIVLSSPEAVREAFLEKGADFSDRPQSFSVQIFDEYFEPLSLKQDSPVWKVQRKIAHQALRKFATGSSLETLINKRAVDLTDLMLKEDGKPFDPFEHLNSVIYSSVISMIFGKIFENDDPWMRDMIQRFNKLSEDFSSGLTADLIPILAYFPSPTVRRLRAFLKELTYFIAETIEEHRKNFDPNDISDFVYLILEAEMQARDDPNEEKEVLRSLTDKHFIGILFDMFTGGTDTTRQTLRWVVALCVEHPLVQAKIQKEIDEVIGMDGMVKISDRHKLPYTEAVIFETLRMYPFAPFAFPHTTNCDATLREFTIPKGTMVMPNIWALHRNPKLWDDPNTFQPERWLDENGEHISHPFKFLPFSTGRRVCVGEALAKTQLHLLTAMLFQKLTLKAVPNEDGTPFKAEKTSNAFDCVSTPFKVIAEQRN